MVTTRTTPTLRRWLLALTCGLAAVAGAAPTDAAPGPVEVLADGDAGWRFNRDPASSTPYELTDARASIGEGSLHVLPIANVLPNGSDKFVAELPLGLPSSDLRSVAYDFLVDGPNGDPFDAKDFYLNVYVNLPGSTTFFDCRYDYVPTEGSTTAFTTAAFDVAAPTRVASSAAGCAAHPGAMPAGSTIRGMAINVGQSNSRDTGLGGYLDNVVVTTASATTTYDFDVPSDAPTKDGCKDGGWRDLGFRNQGRCVAAAEAAARLAGD